MAEPAGLARLGIARRTLVARPSTRVRTDPAHRESATRVAGALIDTVAFWATHTHITTKQGHCANAFAGCIRCTADTGKTVGDNAADFIDLITRTKAHQDRRKNTPPHQHEPYRSM